MSSLQWVLLHPPPGVGDSDGQQTPGGWSNLRLKIVGLVLLTAGTFSRSILFPTFVGKATADIGLWPLTGALAMEVAAWVSIPIYAWLLVKGFQHTRSVARYGLRLLVLALVCEMPYDLGNGWRVWDFSSQNPVFGLVFCLVVIWTLSRLRGRPGPTAMLLRGLVVVAGVLYMMVLHIDQHQTIIFGGVITLGFTLVFFYLDAHENTMMLVGTLAGILGAMFPSLGLLAIHRRSDELGYSRKWVPWLFYAAYPVMLAVLAVPHM